MTTATLPTRKDEAWRYSDLNALKKVWGTVEQTVRTLNVGANEVSAAQDRIGGSGWHNERIEILVGSNGRHERTLVQQADADGLVTQDYQITLEAGATCRLFVLNAGASFGRIAISVKAGEGAHFELGGAILGGGSQTLEIVTTMNHAEPNGTSNQVVRSVLARQATGSYLGRVEVARHAQKTDAEQSVKAMLLDRTATANAKPELEIFADDVKCAHGATVGELDRQALFYLASRGLPPPQAKALMLRAFIAEVFEPIEDETIREQIDAAAMDALERML